MELRAADWSQSMRDTEAALHSLRAKVQAEEGATALIDLTEKLQRSRRSRDGRCGDPDRSLKVAPDLRLELL